MLLQYVADLLISSPNKAACEADTLQLLQALAEKGHKVNRDKLQLVQERVKYLAHHISHGKSESDKGRITSIAEVPRPRTKKELMRFLGMATNCRQWIVDYAILTKELYAIVGKNQTNVIACTGETEGCFNKLKVALSMAPALSLPDYEKPFFLYTHKINGVTQAVLTQQHAITNAQ